MNKNIFKAIEFSIIFLLLMPITSGLKFEANDLKTNQTSSDSFIQICIEKIDYDGYLFFKVTNYCVEDIGNETVSVDVFGAYNRRHVISANTGFFIQNLPIGQSGIFKTEEPVIDFGPLLHLVQIILHRFLIYGVFELNLTFNGDQGSRIVNVYFTFIRCDPILFPYP